jgi:hypothetical protein
MSSFSIKYDVDDLNSKSRLDSCSSDESPSKSSKCICNRIANLFNDVLNKTEATSQSKADLSPDQDLALVHRELKLLRRSQYDLTYKFNMLLSRLDSSFPSDANFAHANNPNQNPSNPLNTSHSSTNSPNLLTGAKKRKFNSNASSSNNSKVNEQETTTAAAGTATVTIKNSPSRPCSTSSSNSNESVRDKAPSSEKTNSSLSDRMVKANNEAINEESELENDHPVELYENEFDENNSEQMDDHLLLNELGASDENDFEGIEDRVEEIDNDENSAPVTHDNSAHTQNDKSKHQNHHNSHLNQRSHASSSQRSDACSVSQHQQHHPLTDGPYGFSNGNRALSNQFNRSAMLNMYKQLPPEFHSHTRHQPPHGMPLNHPASVSHGSHRPNHMASPHNPNRYPSPYMFNPSSGQNRPPPPPPQIPPPGSHLNPFLGHGSYPQHLYTSQFRPPVPGTGSHHPHHGSSPHFSPHPPHSASHSSHSYTKVFFLVVFFCLFFTL